jgi:hypothetical protein
MTIFKQFEALNQEEISKIYESLEKSIEYHKKRIESWKNYVEQIKEFELQTILNQETLDIQEKHHETMAENVVIFSKILEKLKPLKELVNNE